MSDVINHSITCKMCAEPCEMELPAKGFFRWHVDGELIQNAMPELSPDVREILISGICGSCFDRMFSGE